MSFRINPFKILRIVGIIGVITYAGVEYSNYKSRVVKETSEITKDIKIRTKDFYMTQDYKNNLTVPQQTVDQTNKDVTKVIAAKDSDTKKVDLANDGQKKDNSTEEVKKQEEAKKNEEAKKQEEARKEQQELDAKREKQEAQRKAEVAAAKAAAEKKAQQQAEAAKIAAAKKAQQEAIAKAKAEAAKKAAVKKGPKKYLQVASLASESAAKATVRRLGGNFRYQKSSVNGRTVYVVMSAMTTNPSTLSSMERQVKSRLGTGYIVRTIGK
nr:sporulation protein [uncultured Leptotrichia sp.]